MSLELFVVALRHLGAAHTGAHFSVAPFLGASVAVALGEPLTLPLLTAGALMALRVWLHMTERHDHDHVNEPLQHSHAQGHDAHHQHPHDDAADSQAPHAHPHEHAPLHHRHAHFPDSHHAHPH